MRERENLTEAKELETQLEKAEEDLYEHQTRGEQDISEENQQVTREEIRNLRLTAEAHRVERDEAGENTEITIIHEPLHKILQERKDLIAELELEKKEETFRMKCHG